MNKVVLIGRLTKDPELRFTPNNGTAVATFTLAVDRKFLGPNGQKETDFIPIVVWGKMGETVANYMNKGRLIAISGRMQTRSYDAKDGTKRYVTEVVADDVQFLDKGQSQTQQTRTNSPSPEIHSREPQYDAYAESDFGNDMTPIDEGDIPF